MACGDDGAADVFQVPFFVIGFITLTDDCDASLHAASVKVHTAACSVARIRQEVDTMSVVSVCVIVKQQRRSSGTAHHQF